MYSSALAQKTNAAFTQSFYRPYALAVQTAFLLLCSLREQMRAEDGEQPSVRAMTFRLKTPASIGEKLRRKGLPVSPEAAGAALHDIAGLRVVLADTAQVYRFAGLLCASPIVELTDMRDYIASPKRSGYRSLHLILRLPVSLDGQMYMIPVEVQLRTAAMDIWASIEHDMVYKPVACARAD